MLASLTLLPIVLALLGPRVHRLSLSLFFFFQAEDGIRDRTMTGVQTCALPISRHSGPACPLPGHARAARRRAPAPRAWPRDRKSVVVGKECRSRWSPYH